MATFMVNVYTTIEIAKHDEGLRWAGEGGSRLRLSGDPNVICCTEFAMPVHEAALSGLILDKCPQYCPEIC